MRRVNDIIASKPSASNTISPDTLVIEALELLNSVNLSYLIVLENDEYQGVFSERDYARNLILKGRSSKDTRVKNVMATDLPTVQVDDSVEQCMNLMNTHRTRYLVAFNDMEFAGIITIHDLLRQVIASKEEVFDHSLARQLIDNDESGRIF